jgi:chromosome segregation protein
MYLKRLEMQGFKTFAQRVIMEFVPQTSGRRGVTAIVGPNGSGKSNAADAIRWVMGEQSLKLLRGKKSEDVIFSGTEKRARSGFAEVVMILENDDKPEVDLAEIQITRRLYRDGNSEYEINQKPARLTDVALLLAQCGVGQRTYSVIGQGMVDAVLVASPSERKEFFDEAFGLKPFQLKRNSALHKIDDAKTNLLQTETLLREISPRLQTLERHIQRLQQRETLEAELRTLERHYYVLTWRDLHSHIQSSQRAVDALRLDLKKKEDEIEKLNGEFQRMEQSTPQSDGFHELRVALDALQAERGRLRERQMELNTKRAVAAVRAEKPWSPLPLSKIIDAVDVFKQKHEELDVVLSKKDIDRERLKVIVSELKVLSTELIGKLQRPAPEPETVVKHDPEIEREMQELVEQMTVLAERISQAEEAIDQWNRQEEQKRRHIFDVQRVLNQKREEAHGYEMKINQAAIDLTRLESRMENLMQDLRQHAPALEAELETTSLDPGFVMSGDILGRLQKIRSQLEWIGGIDPETQKEYDETKERHSFLDKQTTDLRETLQSLDLVVEELDTTIRERSSKAFAALDREFGVYFKQLFGGGDAKLVEVKAEPVIDEETGQVLEEVYEEDVAGIEIHATPPGKRNKAIALLSGGERALTSIALICAIMATNPSPFVVLDEVDAALDESNSRKFAEIISRLADKTQFVVVTHNRATMTEASVLYGVTMGDDGVSQLLSVKLEDVAKK